MAAETGFSHHAITAALRRHGLSYVGHVAKRHAASQGADEIAAALGYSSVAEYAAQRRTQGWTWKAISTTAPRGDRKSVV